MELRVLRYFLAVTHEKNITKAADILHVTQPTLSRQLMDLEEELGTTLFIRGKREITLTDDGILLRQRAEEIVELAEKTEREFTQREDRIGGVITLGCVESMGTRLLADLIEQFSLKYSGVQFDLYNGYSDDIKEKLDKGLMDIGLLLDPIDISKYDYIRLNQKEIWGVLVPDNHPFAHRDNVTLRELSEHPLILPKRMATQNEILNWFHAEPGQLKIIATYSLLSNAVLLVERQMGCAVCMDGALSIRHSTDTVFVPITPEHATGSVLVWKKNRIFGTASSLFIRMANQLNET